MPSGSGLRLRISDDSARVIERCERFMSTQQAQKELAPEPEPARRIRRWTLQAVFADGREHLQTTLASEHVNSSTIRIRSRSRSPTRSRSRSRSSRSSNNNSSDSGSSRNKS